MSYLGIPKSPKVGIMFKKQDWAPLPQSGEAYCAVFHYAQLDIQGDTKIIQGITK